MFLWVRLPLADSVIMAFITRKVSYSAIQTSCIHVRQQFPWSFKFSNFTKCREQKEKRADHDPLALWKEDPSSPYNCSIIANPLGMAGGYISESCKMRNWGYNTVERSVNNSISFSLAVAALVRASFFDNSIPTFFTSIKRIWIAEIAIHAAQYKVAKVKQTMIKTNIANVERDLSPRRL